MFTRDELIKLAESDAKKHKPNTGYRVQAMKDVCAAKIPLGENIGIQFALQFTGKNETMDLVKNTEKQLPYGGSFSLDEKGDCLDFCRNVTNLFFPKIKYGDWTEGSYQLWKTHQVPWEKRRPFDLLLFKLSSRNPHATHASLYMGDGNMIHTRSKSKPLMVTKDDIYSAKSRAGTGVFRILTDEQYQMLIVDSFPPESNVVYYTVKKGDSLSGIAKKYGTSVKQLMAWNKKIKKASLIVVGWVLRVR